MFFHFTIFFIFLQQLSEIEFWTLQLQNKLQTTGIDSSAERRMLSFMFDHVSQSKTQTLRPNHTVLRRAALSGAEGRRPVLDGGYLASRLLKYWSLTFDRVTDSLMFNMDCVSNGLGHSWFPVTSYRWKCLACCAHQRLLFQHIHKFLLCKDVRPRKRSLFHCPPACSKCQKFTVHKFTRVTLLWTHFCHSRLPISSAVSGAN